MLDLNRLFLFVAVVSPLVVLARTAPRTALNRGWQLAATAVLAVAVLAWLVTPQNAGYVAGGAWLLLLFLPAVGLRKAAEFLLEERYATARRIVAPLRWLHPAQAVRDELIFLRAMEAAQNGATDLALRGLESLRGARSRAGLQATAQSFRIRGDWPALVEWSRKNLPFVGLGREPALLLLYFRALGETGSLDELALQVAGRTPALLASPQHRGTFDASALILLAFLGRTEALARLLQTRLRRLHPDVKEFWLGTGEMAAGRTETGRVRLETLRAKTGNALLRAEIAPRLNTGPEQRAAPGLTTVATVRRFETNLALRRGSLLAASSRPSPAVAVFICLNVAMFVLEMAWGGATNSLTLHRLGALEPFAVLAHGEYWRLLTALFLHFGALHLLVNLYALYVLGPPLEGSIGSGRFIICYLVAGLGSSAGVVLFWRLGWTRADLLVGASGAVMGVVGAWAGLLIRHRHLSHARRRLANIGTIIVIQTVFDFYTPQVSMAAHLGGAASGLIIALLIVPRREEW
ncbi:MAG TPA: rhomboid family intramembrane serine protease [Chthoniobacterales bacterium]|nr:rhomboid family intramembrane serine protease [Chthoniobacterales bacterium]